MELRAYQTEAVESLKKYFAENTGRNPLIVIPTGGGKTPILAAICDWVAKTGKTGRVLVVTHVKELLLQAKDKINRYNPALEVGVYSAGLGLRDTKSPIILAGIQSIYRRSHEFGAFDMVIVDEAHCVPQEEEGMYRTLFSALARKNPETRFVGLTATPYRMKTGFLCSPKGIFQDVCYAKNVRSLIDEGWLCDLKTRMTVTKYDTENLHIRAGEFVPEEVEELMNGDEKKLHHACCEIVTSAITFQRKKVLVFASSVDHAKKIKEHLESLINQEVGIVLGETTDKERAETLERFQSHGEDSLQYLVNVSVLTTGFDNPEIDLIALLRPTASPGLYYQMVGRGLRIAPAKTECLVLDFGQNIDRHGPINELIWTVKKPEKKRKGKKPVKVCPKCQYYVSAAVRKCPYCGNEFPLIEGVDRLTGYASIADVLSDKDVDLIEEILKSQGSVDELVERLELAHEMLTETTGPLGYEWFSIENQRNLYKRVYEEVPSRAVFDATFELLRKLHIKVVDEYLKRQQQHRNAEAKYKRSIEISNATRHVTINNYLRYIHEELIPVICKFNEGLIPYKEVKEKIEEAEETAERIGRFGAAARLSILTKDDIKKVKRLQDLDLPW